MSQETPIAARRGAGGANRPASPTAAGLSWRARPWVGELLVASAVFLYSVATLPIHAGDGRADDNFRLVALGAISVLLCAPYLFRRRYPVQSLLVMLAAALTQLLLGPDAALIAADAMFLLAVHNVATRFEWSVSLWGAAAVVGWLLVAVAPRMSALFLGIGEFGVLVLLVVWVWTWGALVRIRREYIASLRLRARELEQERDTQARIAAADERARIAREIHDVVAHSLSVVVVLSEGAAATTESDPERAKSTMLKVRDTGRDSLTQMRRVLDVLRSDEPGAHTPQPSIAELRQLIDVARAAGLPVTMHTEGRPATLSTDLEFTVYRVVQEALTNARKHGGTALSSVEVVVRYGQEAIEIRVIDDGRGFTDSSHTPAGHGLIGMRERVAAYDGVLRTGMRPGGGFEVSAVLPIGGER